MLESIRKAVPYPSLILPAEAAVAVLTTACFVWLLMNGYVQPIAIFLLELYLSL